MKEPLGVDPAPTTSDSPFNVRRELRLMEQIGLILPNSHQPLNFNDVRVAALYLLTIYDIPILDFLNWVFNQRQTILNRPNICLSTGSGWKTMLLYDKSLKLLSDMIMDVTAQNTAQTFDLNDVLPELSQPPEAVSFDAGVTLALKKSKDAKPKSTIKNKILQSKHLLNKQTKSPSTNMLFPSHIGTQTRAQAQALALVRAQEEAFNIMKAQEAIQETNEECREIEDQNTESFILKSNNCALSTSENQTTTPMSIFGYSHQFQTDNDPITPPPSFSSKQLLLRQQSTTSSSKTKVFPTDDDVPHEPRKVRKRSNTRLVPELEGIDTCADCGKQGQSIFNPQCLDELGRLHYYFYCRNKNCIKGRSGNRYIGWIAKTVD